jgi:hypothetical protein
MSKESIVSLLNPSRTGTTVALWLVEGIPVRLRMDDLTYRVTDTPTRLEDENPDLAYRLGLSEWRFQATDPSGASRVFDIRRSGDGWVLVRVYD